MTIPDSVRARARELWDEDGNGVDEGCAAKALAVCEHLAKIDGGYELLVGGDEYAAEHGWNHLELAAEYVKALAAWAVSEEEP